MSDPNVPVYCTLDGDVSSSVIPFRPGVANVGGAAHVNDDEYPPIPPHDVTAEAINQQENLIVRACRMMPAASFWVRNVAGTVTLLGFKSCNDHFSAGDLTITSVLGALIIAWPNGKLPAGTVPPAAQLVVGAALAVGPPQTTQTHTSSTSAIEVQILDYSSTPVGTYTVRVDCDGEGAFGA
jgi:hypothetical protein